MTSFRSTHPLGDFQLTARSFSAVDSMLQALLSGSSNKNIWEKKMLASRICLEQILLHTTPCFLLPEVVDFLDKAQEIVPIHFNEFEFYLITESALSFEEELDVRAKIVGRSIPRADFQLFFPVGNHQIYPGSHFVTSHFPIDLDTTIASFWGWMEAFGCKVGAQLHRFNLPVTGDEEIVEFSMLFDEPFGTKAKELLSISMPILSPMAIDLTQKEGVCFLRGSEPYYIERPAGKHAVVVVDEKGLFLGDWKSSDVEAVIYVINGLVQCLTWMENRCITEMISLFSDKKKQGSLQELFSLCFDDVKFLRQFSPLLQGHILQLVQIFTQRNSGQKTSYLDFLRLAAQLHQAPETEKFLQKMKDFSLENSDLSFLRDLVFCLTQSTQEIILLLGTLSMGLSVKYTILKIPKRTVDYKSSLDELLVLLDNDPFITVTIEDGKSVVPIGVVYAEDAKRKVVGTVSLRDFSNKEEVRIPSSLEVISVMDHHRTDLTTKAPAVIFIGDYQSCNVAIAERSFVLSDRYGTGGMNEKEIDGQLALIAPLIVKGDRLAVFHKLAQRKLALSKEGRFFVDPYRELFEYFCYFFAILDDTDLLTKVTQMDVECVRSLLSRMRSIVSGSVEEVVCFSDLARDRTFAKHAAARLLKNKECYSLYSRVWEQKEKAIFCAIEKALQGSPEVLFRDTKQQGGIASVCQIKYYPKNIEAVQKHKDAIASIWVEKAEKITERLSDVTLHIMMLSTMKDAQQLYEGSSALFNHQDELWIHLPMHEVAKTRLALFLRSFKNIALAHQKTMHVRCSGPYADLLADIVKEWFCKVPVTVDKSGPSMVAIVHDAALFVSRKKDITPHIAH